MGDRVVDVVDDDEAVLDSLRALLESYGFLVRGYASAKDYLTGADHSGTRCLVVDLHMPEMSGLDLLKSLRARGRRFPAILITGRGEKNLHGRAAEVGAVGMLHKPIDDAALVSLINTIMDNHP